MTSEIAKSFSDLHQLTGRVYAIGNKKEPSIVKVLRLSEDDNLFRDHFTSVSAGNGFVFHSFEIHPKKGWLDFLFVAFIKEDDGNPIPSCYCGGLSLNGIKNHLFYLEEWQRLKARYLQEMEPRLQGVFSTNKLARLKLTSLSSSAKEFPLIKELLDKEIHFHKVISKLAKHQLLFDVAHDRRPSFAKDARAQKAQATAPYRDVWLLIYELMKHCKESKRVYLTDYIGLFTKRTKEFHASEVADNLLSYRWVNSPLKEKQIACLYNRLKEEEYIDKDTKLEDFKKAFNGAAINSPLRIKFIKRTRNKSDTCKRSLFYLLYRLGERNLVLKEDTVFGKNMEYSQAFQERLKFVFVDHDGNLFKNIVGSRIEKDHTVIDYPEDRTKIDSIVESVEAIVA